MSTRFGFDTGTTHVGMAQIEPIHNTAKLWQITMHRIANTMSRILAIQEILKNCDLYFPAKFDVIIEGSAYSKAFRQSELAEIRTSAALYFERYGGQCYFVAPNSIRKQVLGNGRKKAHEFWQSEIGPDALAALACSYYVKEK